MLQREQVGYLRDAVVTLPERLRKVVVEYFFEERQMQDIANDLGVTESRVSQMRAEALVLLRAGLESALDTDNAPAAEEPKGRAAKRTAAYMAAVAAASRSEEHTSELQSLMRISYAVFCLKKKTTNTHTK